MERTLVPIMLVGGAVIFGCVYGIYYLTEEQGKVFREACTQSGGTPAFDGRQWQCLKKVTP